MTKMGINELNDAWIAKGQELSDLDSKLNAAVLNDDFSTEKFNELKGKRDQLKVQRDAIKDQLNEARAVEVVKMKGKDKKPLTDKEKDMKKDFVNNFKNMVRGRFDAVTSSTETDIAGNGGLTIPVDVQTAIHTLVRQFATLQNLVNVESVSTTSGSRVYEVLSDMTPMAKIDSEGAEIGAGDDPKLRLIKYAIDEYGAINTVTNNPVSYTHLTLPTILLV